MLKNTVEVDFDLFYRLSTSMIILGNWMTAAFSGPLYAIIRAVEALNYPVRENSLFRD